MHDDGPEGLRLLREAGVRLVTLTNGTVALSEGAFARADVLNLFEARLSVDDVGRWKPAADAYQYAARVTGEPPGRLTLVASHPWDVDGAVRAGLGGAWLNRRGARYPSYMRPPTVTGTCLPDLARALI
ncbi:MAG: HAD family hydrolase [Actinomycetes bacterium]